MRYEFAFQNHLYEFEDSSLENVNITFLCLCIYSKVACVSTTVFYTGLGTRSLVPQYVACP